MNAQKSHITKNKQDVNKLKNTYLHWTAVQLEQLHSSLHSLEREDINDPDKFLTEICDLARNIRGLGGSFGYFLMTDIASSLCKYINDAENIFYLHSNVIAAHITAMDMVICEEIEGGGGDRGLSMVAGLDKMVAEEALGMVNSSTRRQTDSGKSQKLCG